MLTAPWQPEGSLGVRNFGALGFRVQGVFPSALLWVSSLGRYGTRKATNYTETRNLLHLRLPCCSLRTEVKLNGPLIFLAWITITITCRASSDDSRATRTLHPQILPWSLISKPEKNEASVCQA